MKQFIKTYTCYFIVVLMVITAGLYKLSNGLLSSIGKLLLMSLNYLNNSRYLTYNEALGSNIKCLTSINRL